MFDYRIIANADANVPLLHTCSWIKQIITLKTKYYKDSRFAGRTFRSTPAVEERLSTAFRGISVTAGVPGNVTPGIGYSM